VKSISMHSALFARKGVHSHCGGVNRSVEAREADPGKLLRQAFSVRKGAGAIEFKLFPDHMVGVSVAQRELCEQVRKRPRGQSVSQDLLERGRCLGRLHSAFSATVVFAPCRVVSGGCCTGLGSVLGPPEILTPFRVTRDPWRVLLDPHVKKISLQRKNQLAVAVSILRAQITGAYKRHNAGRETITDGLQVTISPADLEAFCDCYDAYYRFLNRATIGQRALELTYEELIEYEEAAVARVCSFLGVPRGDSILHPVFVKQTRRATLDARDVSNWEELVTAFHGTPRSWV
jgi:hypothetical protein